MKKITRNRSDRGFTLVELLVAAAIFVLISGAALSLVAQHQPLFNRQQNMAALNIQIRNAVSQLQLDTINAGTGYYQGINIPDFPIGVTIQNNTATPCNTPATFTYGPNCFDVLNIITVDSSTPPSHPSDSTGAACSKTTGSPIYATPVAPTTPAQLAADYKTGDQLLLLTTGSPQKVTSVILTADATVSGALVKLQFSPTLVGGTNTADHAYIANNPTSYLGDNFCPVDWLVKITPITYKVDTSTASNPKLIREQPSGSANDVVVSDQIIGFKVGAITWNSCTPACTSDDGSTYNYNSNNYVSGGVAQNYNFSLIRSVQIELIGRTTPNPDPSYVYRNGFDGGPYQIQSVSVVVNPRNLTMNNN